MRRKFLLEDNGLGITNGLTKTSKYSTKIVDIDSIIRINNNKKYLINTLIKISRFILIVSMNGNISIVRSISVLVKHLLKKYWLYHWTLTVGIS